MSSVRPQIETIEELRKVAILITIDRMKLFLPKMLFKNPNKSKGVRNLLLGVMIFTAVAVVGLGVTVIRDRTSLPPIERIVCSSVTKLCARIIRPEKLRPGPKPELTIGHPDTPNKNHVRQLEYVVGPRLIIALNSGFIVTFDEWLRHFDTQYAIQIFSSDGLVIATFSAAEVISIAGESEVDVKENAAFGPWMASEPVILDDGVRVEFTVGRKPIILDLSSSAPKLYRKDQ